jgi:hypothetical protein
VPDLAIPVYRDATGAGSSRPEPTLIFADQDRSGLEPSVELQPRLAAARQSVEKLLGLAIEPAEGILLDAVSKHAFEDAFDKIDARVNEWVKQAQLAAAILNVNRCSLWAALGGAGATY